MKNHVTYSYAQSVKSDISDELINTYVLRPLAGLLVRAVYSTPITPNQVTVAGVVWGLCSAMLYAAGTPISTMMAGLCLTLKDLFDSADGQLARAKQMYSRTGRFLDSIGDFLVNLLVFGAISFALFSRTGNPIAILVGMAGFLGVSLRVSYHVFYHTSFLHLRNSYTLNRTNEELREGDDSVDRLTFRLHQLFLVLYGWQDRFMERIDRWCRGTLLQTRVLEEQWYGDRVGLRISGMLGLGTELFLLTACSVVNRLDAYFFLNLIFMNGVWVASVMYRRYVLARQLRPGQH